MSTSFPLFSCQRRGFSVLEVVLALAAIGIIAGVTVPLYHDYQIRNDLNLATEQTTQGLRRAQLLSQSTERDSSWGFFVPAGTLYRGTSYDLRDASFDEVYPMPSAIKVTGLNEVSYARITGKPSVLGTIVLTALNDETRSIVIDVPVQSTAVNQNDLLTICHHGQTMNIVDSSWLAHQAHGDTLGACVSGSSMTSSPVASSSVNSASSAVSSVGGGGGGGESGGGGGGGESGTRSSLASSSSSCNGDATGNYNTNCDDTSDSTKMTICHFPAGNSVNMQTLSVNFSGWPVHRDHHGGDIQGACPGCSDMVALSTKGSLITTRALNITVTSMFSKLTYGTGGPQIPVYLSYSLNGGGKWTSLLGGNKVSASGPTGGDSQTLSNVAKSSDFAVKIRGYFEKQGWLTYDENVATNDSTGHVLLLRDGDSLPAYPAFANTSTLPSPLRSYISSSTGKIAFLNTSTTKSIIALVQLGAVDSSAKFLDEMFIIEFAPVSSSSCP